MSKNKQKSNIIITPPESMPEPTPEPTPEPEPNNIIEIELPKPNQINSKKKRGRPKKKNENEDIILSGLNIGISNLLIGLTKVIAEKTGKNKIIMSDTEAKNIEQAVNVCLEYYSPNILKHYPLIYLSLSISQYLIRVVIE